jgi:hypothetical protein
MDDEQLRWVRVLDLDETAEKARCSAEPETSEPL